MTRFVFLAGGPVAFYGEFEVWPRSEWTALIVDIEGDVVGWTDYAQTATDALRVCREAVESQGETVMMQQRYDHPLSAILKKRQSRVRFFS